MTAHEDRTAGVPLALRATVRGWLAESDALSALPDAPVVVVRGRRRRKVALRARRR